jgi:3-oxoacyl-[acyl-carrier protein] reductase
MRLEDARVLITGGGTGIGLATARQLVEGGAKVAVCGRRREPLESAATEFGAVPIQADVSLEAQADLAVGEALRHLGGLNVLVNNAAVGYFAMLVDIDLAQWEQLLRVNLTGAMLVGRAAARHFVQHGGGTLINVASTAAGKGFPGGSAYCASKFGLTALTECWRGELRKHDVRVMQVNPSEVQTEFGRGGTPRTEWNATKLIAKDVAHVVTSMLTLPDRGFITDATLWATNLR